MAIETPVSVDGALPLAVAEVTLKPVASCVMLLRSMGIVGPVIVSFRVSVVPLGSAPFVNVRSWEPTLRPVDLGVDPSGLGAGIGKVRSTVLAAPRLL